MAKNMGFVSALLDFFGRKEEQSVQSFATEVKQLTEADRLFFRKELERVGYTLTN